ncbi:hypothetical protein KQI58_16895 [Enterococcus raffinosus]|uniref:GapS4b family protein n=1 Tax=Enterococcus raffinosus TaxID=71452 RepID=UPI001C123DD0|nr:hypothetical protein [Enterococcus raffinosus]MBU5362747.1 hypothetical protein [Enterococcus raffinosus]
MNREKLKNTETVLPFGNTLKPLITTASELSISEIRSCLAQKGIFINSKDKDQIIPLMLTSLLSPYEFNELRERRKDRESIPKRRSKTYSFNEETKVIKAIPMLNKIDITDLKRWDTENYEIYDKGTFSRYKDSIVYEYKIIRQNYAKDWYNQESIHVGSLEFSVDNDSKNLILSSEHSSEETKELNNLILKEAKGILETEGYIEKGSEKSITFGNFTNENRINFLLNFVDDTLDESDTFKFSKITNVDILFDPDKELTNNLQWMQDKVRMARFEGDSLHETEVLQDTGYHSSLILSSLKIVYEFETKTANGECTIEVEFPRKRSIKVPNHSSELVFKLVQIKCKNKDNRKGMKKTLYRKFDIFKDACYKKTLSRDINTD